jgi:hypothetical protein
MTVGVGQRRERQWVIENSAHAGWATTRAKRYKRVGGNQKIAFLFYFKAKTNQN